MKEQNHKSKSNIKQIKNQKEHNSKTISSNQQGMNVSIKQIKPNREGTVYVSEKTNERTYSEMTEMDNSPSHPRRTTKDGKNKEPWHENDEHISGPNSRICEPLRVPIHICRWLSFNIHFFGFLCCWRRLENEFNKGNKETQIRKIFFKIVCNFITKYIFRK